MTPRPPSPAPGMPPTPGVASGRWVVPAAAAGAAGGTLWAFGLAVDPRQAWFSYLAAFAYASSLAAGALAFVAIVHVSHSRTLLVVRRLAEGAAAALPALALLAVPLLLGAGSLYPWTAPPAELHGHLREAVLHKAPWLNLPAFAVRTAAYFAVWLAALVPLLRWSRLQDAGEGERLAARQRMLSAGALPLLAITLTFAAFDWLMSLAPAWYSTAFGVYYSAGALLGATALLVAVARTAERGGSLAGVLGPGHYHALGKLLLTFTVFWAYIAYAQAFIVWIADIPEEVTWYLPRLRGGWAPVSAFLAVGHFALPFLLLLSRDLKRRPRALTAVAAWLLGVHFVDVHWLVLPALHPEGPRPSWIDAAALLFVLGPAVACAASWMRGLPPIPRGAPGIERALERGAR